ncbi:ATP-grasp fold amidoligase family protein [Corynebacterium gottingense]|uniref:ATP-grasp fold amidoligase family protein n=1 Tax=Corynebacterium gottingense TaxID=2041036 RepID=UPI00142D49C3|nr:ATP-grasp fold amidoligase family protein [Corynebacterium gottingense]WJZ13617.1 hypothetical protein CGOTT_08515 [Corynebacterium gottingense]WJZ15935.1 hypothetical protein CGOTTB_08480 [Corynebacterium gottingense]
MTTWVKKVEERLNHTEKNVPWWVNDKAKLHTFCQENEIPMPRLYKYWDTPEELVSLDELPSKFVLKPTVMHSNWGVQLLERRENGRYWDSLNRREYGLEGIKLVQEEAYSKCNYKGQYKLMAEEFVESPDPKKPVPLDYKVYCFYDQPLLIQQVDRNSGRDRHVFFDGDFNELPRKGYVESDWKHIDYGEPVIPADPDALLDAAVKTTVKLGTPFMRVDMFHGKQGTVLGELTPAPGPLYYKKIMWLSESFDLELGSAWVRAEARTGQ